MKAIFFVAIIGLLVSCDPTKHLSSAQQEDVANGVDNAKKKTFPPVNVTPFGPGTLGALLQEQFKAQAQSCGIIRQDDRLYIPRTIFNTYTDAVLRNTKLASVGVSAGNFLFLTLKKTEKATIPTLTENTFTSSRRIVGLSDLYIPNFSEAIIQSPNGYPGFVQKKSCSGFYEASGGATVKAPSIEMSTSLSTDASYSSSLTLVNAQFVSPLTSLIKGSGPLSIYTHLLLWQIYADDFVNNNPTTQDKANLLINDASYVSEFRGVSIFRATDSKSDFSVSAKLSAGIAANIFSANGSVSAGTTSNSSFSLKDFSTNIFDPQNETYTVTKLPSYQDIITKLQSAPSQEGNPFQGSGLVTSLLPFSIVRVLNGIPIDLCGTTSWDIANWDTDIWASKPTVTSVSVPRTSNGLPQCACKITGSIKPAAIASAAGANSSIVFKYDLVNTLSIDDKKLIISVIEQPAPITTSPNFNYNDYSINVLRTLNSGPLGNQYSWKLDGTIDDAGLSVATPLQISDATINYSSNALLIYPLTLSPPVINGKNVGFVISSSYFSPTARLTGNDVSVSINISFKVKLANGAVFPKLTTNTITLKIPETAPDMQTQGH